MQNSKVISAEIELVVSFKVLAQAYQEIAVMKMQRIRGSVLRTRDFLEDLSYVFQDVKESYRKEIISHPKMKKNANPLKFSTLNKNGRSVVILLSSNGWLYGDIIMKVYRSFLSYVLKKTSDIVIVGKVGKSLFDDEKIKKPYKYFEVPDGLIALADIKAIISYIIEYENVRVYYGQFINIINQNAIQSVISGEYSDFKKEKNESLNFLFEPGLETLFNFFETQIFSSLFKQAVHESRLSHLASRIRSMEYVLGNIDTKVKHLNREKNKAKSTTAGKKQNDMISGISLWGKNS